MKNIIAIFFSLITLGLSEPALAKESATLPVIQNVGVIPLQWSNESVAETQFYDVKTLLETEYPKAVRSARKYRVVNDDLISGHWEDNASRQEIIETQKIDAFFSLQGQIRDDVAVFNLRLLSPKMETYLFESSSIGVAELAKASRGRVIGLLENLVFKTLNRIPIDAHVTSLQGRYVTISGGQLRGIQVGDTVEIVRTKIVNRHPAHGSWMNITTQRLGVATIVEVKTYTSVAKLENMIAEDAIHVGDGMRIPGINTRAKFQEMAQPRQPQKVQDPIIVNPMYAGDTEAKPVLPAARRPAPVAEEQNSIAAADGNLPETVASENVTSHDVPSTDEFAEFMHHLVDYGRAQVGMRLWNYSGDATAKSNFPLILINHGRLIVGKAMTKDIVLEAIGHANFGTTSRGSFFGFGGGGRMFMRRPLEEGRHWRVGAEGYFSSLAVTDQTYGGADIISGGAFVGLEGPFRLSESMINYYLEFALLPVNLGQMGIAGSKRTIQSSFAYKFSVGGELQQTEEQEQAGEIVWGGVIEVENYSYSLDGNRKLSGSSFNMLGTAGWKF